MGWIASKKVYSILMNDEEGKKIVEKAPDLSQEELEKEIDEFFGKNDRYKKEDVEDKTENKEKEKYQFNYKITDDDKSNLRSLFKYVFRKNRNEEISFDLLIEDLEECNSEQRYLFMKCIGNTVQSVWQNKGEGFFSPYEYKIILDREMLEESYNYVRNGVAFHEFGHAIDYLLSTKGYASCNYISDKYNTTMLDMLESEFNQTDWEKVKEELENYSSTSKIDEKMQTAIDNKINELKTEKENIANNYRDDMINAICDKYGLSKDSKLFTEVDKRVKNKFELNDELKQEYDNITDYLFDKVGTKGFDFKEYSYAFDALNSVIFRNNIGDFPTKILPKKIRDNFEKEVKENIKKTVKIENFKSSISSTKAKDWADVSDMYSGFTKNKGGKMGLINFGHTTKYWNSTDKKAIAMECFAELFQGMAVNPRSYNNMKRFFPKTVEIFEEIIKKYGKE